MNYTKPEVAVLGEAAQVIQGGRKPLGYIPEAIAVYRVTPAYELDE
jgi:hypothetical protein